MLPSLWQIAPMAEPATRAFGRNLADFLDAEGKLPAPEERLRAACARGDVCELGKTRPQRGTVKNRVRASFIRFLALGGDSGVPVHENGVWLFGGWIDGVLDLNFCTLSGPLHLRNCRLEQLDACEARLPRLDLRGTLLAAGINADGIRVTGSVFLDDGFTATGDVRLLGAIIGGGLQCSGGNFHGTTVAGKIGDALSCDGATIADNVFLNTGFNAKGTVGMLGASIGGNLECRGGKFNGTIDAGKIGDALSCKKATITGSVFLDAGFTATGMVRLVGAGIGGDLQCSGGKFDGTTGDGPIGNALAFDGAIVTGRVVLDAGFTATGTVRLLGASIGGNLQCNGGKFDGTTGDGPMGDALLCNRATITGGVFLDTGFTATGNVSLAAISIGNLIDAETDWPNEPSTLVLDGMRIGRFAENAPTDGATRVRWLLRQRSAHLNEDFKPQPWEETIRVLREMGHPEDAKIVAVAKQDQLRRAGRLTGVARPLHFLWGRLAGYGYRPLRLMGWMLLVWAIGSGMFWLGMKGGYMAPTSPIVITSGQIDAACDAGPNAGERRWTLCPKLPDEYSTFQPTAYALDLLLPVISLQQDTEWAPVVGNAKKFYGAGIALRGLMWFIILFGWVASLMLIAILTNLVKKD